MKLFAILLVLLPFPLATAEEVFIANYLCNDAEEFQKITLGAEQQSELALGKSLACGYLCSPKDGKTYGGEIQLSYSDPSSSRLGGHYSLRFQLADWLEEGPAEIFTLKHYQRQQSELQIGFSLPSSEFFNAAHSSLHAFGGRQAEISEALWEAPAAGATPSTPHPLFCQFYEVD